MDDYIKAVELLTISSEAAKLERQVSELKEKSKDNEYIIKAKLLEKDEEIKQIQEQLRTLTSLVTGISQPEKKGIIKQLINSGIYRKFDNP